MNTTTTNRASTRRKRTIAGSVVALATALAVGFGSSPAFADTTDITSGHIDFVSVNWHTGPSAGLVLGSNYEDIAWEPAGTFDLVVPSTTGPSGTGYIIPQTQAEANSRGVPWAGFSGDESLRDHGYVAGDQITLTLTSTSFTPKPGTSGSGTVAISQDGTPWFTTAGSSAHTFAVTGTDDEVFHQHTKWVFSAAGTYVLTFTATGSHGTAAGAQSYTVKVGL